MTEFIRVTNKFGHPVLLNKASIRRGWVGREGYVCIDFGEQFPEAVLDSFDTVAGLLGAEGKVLPEPVKYRGKTASQIVRDEIDDEVPF